MNDVDEKIERWQSIRTLVVSLVPGAHTVKYADYC